MLAFAKMSSMSTPASSPVKAPNEITLTPRSKIRALLADSDDDSEKENDTVPKRAVSNATTATKSRSNIPKSYSKTSALFDNDSEDDRVIQRAEEQDGQNAGSSADVADDEQNAYERIKRQLLTKDGGKPSMIQSKHAGESASTSESDTVPTTKTLKRKRVQPVAARSTPSRSTSPVARSSPGLFISPEKARSPSAASHHGSDSDSLPTVSNRLQELVAKKREERLAKEHASEEANSSQNGSGAVKKKKSTTRRAVELESETDEDRDMAKKLTQSARPMRKASKKALEEMHKETQRMSRNMQLAHEAKTKTKFATDAFLKKFNFRQPATMIEEVPGPSASSSIPGTLDSEKQQTLATPPSSPLDAEIHAQKIVTTEAPHSSPLPFVPLPEDDDNDDLPDIHSALSEAAEGSTVTATEREAYSSPAPQRMSVKKFGKMVQQPSIIDDDDDDDLVIIKGTRPSAMDLLNFAQPAKSRPSGDLHVARSLGQTKDTRKRGQKVKPGMNAVELQISLQQRAREQAQREREEKIQRLREKGVYVQTAEEKEKEQMQIEDMLERARREADELAKREKETAKREGRETEGAMPDSDDDDDDWDGEEEEVVASGSDEDDDEGSERGDAADDGLDDAVQPDAGTALVDAEAEDAGSEDEQVVSEAEDMEGVEQSTAVLTSRRPRKQIVDSDDEDVEDKQLNTDTMPVTAITPARPVGVTSSPRSALANAFGFAQPQANVGGLSQMFMGTMAESQTSITGDTQAFDSQQDSLAFLRDIPQPTLPDFAAQFADESQDILVTNSQADRSQEQSTQSLPKLFHFETQTQIPYIESQGSQIPEPTQDVGFQHFPTPVKPAQESFVTVDTLPLSRPVFEEGIPLAEEEDQLPKRKGRLVRREQRAASVEKDQEDTLVAESDLEDNEPQSEANVFLVMRKAAENAAAPTFDKKRSDAKGMVQEQAEESDDEYAGLGGVDEEDDGELDEETRKIIDDETNEKLNERAVAKFHADKERAEDEQRVSKLFKDIANGGLRRKRGAEMELWDSDDEDEAAQRRRAMKQREFAKMRKALLADENLGKIGTTLFANVHCVHNLLTILQLRILSSRLSWQLLRTRMKRMMISNFLTLLKSPSRLSHSLRQTVRKQMLPRPPLPMAVTPLKQDHHLSYAARTKLSSQAHLPTSETHCPN